MFNGNTGKIIDNLAKDTYTVDIPIEQKISNAENDLQVMLQNQNVVRDALEVMKKEYAELEVKIAELELKKKQYKTQLIGLNTADKKADNNISAQRSKIKLLTNEFWKNKRG